eukprot:312211_1
MCNKVALLFACLSKLFMVIYGTLNVTKFGLITHTYSNSGPDASFNLTLYWHSQIVICQFINPPNQKNTEYICNDTSNIIILNQQQPYQYKFKIDYNIVNIFRINAIFVIDLNGNTYVMNTFCGAKQFYYFDGLTETLCDPPLNDKFNYSYIELDINTAKLTSLYISFIKNILSYPNSNTPGIIAPESIKSFGIKTSDQNSASTTNTITIILYWDMYMYSCSFIPYQNNQIYQCNETMFIKSISTYKQVMYFLTIENHHSNTVYIDHIFIKDNSQLPYEYKFDTFCTNIFFNHVKFTVSPQTASCTGSTFDKADTNAINMVQFVEFCIGSNDCVSKLAIDFPLELMENAGQSQSGFAYPANLNTTTSLKSNLKSIIDSYSKSKYYRNTISKSNLKSNIDSYSKSKYYRNTISICNTECESNSKSNSFYNTKRFEIVSTTQVNIITTIDKGMDQISNTTHAADFTWLFIVISLTIIVGLVFVLILCWLYVKKLKRERIVNNGTSDQQLQLDIIDMQQVRSASASLDVNMNGIMNKDTTTGMIVNEDEGNHDVMNYHRNTNVGDEGEGHNIVTGGQQTKKESNHDVNNDEFVIEAQNDEEIVGDDEILTPTGSALAT